LPLGPGSLALLGTSAARSPPRCARVAPAKRLKLAGPPIARSLGLRLGFAFEIERHGSADEVPQGGLIYVVAFVDVDGAPDVPLEAGIEQT